MGVERKRNGQRQTLIGVNHVARKGRETSGPDCRQELLPTVRRLVVGERPQSQNKLCMLAMD